MPQKRAVPDLSFSAGQRNLPLHQTLSREQREGEALWFLKKPAQRPGTINLPKTLEVERGASRFLGLILVFGGYSQAHDRLLLA